MDPSTPSQRLAKSPRQPRTEGFAARGSGWATRISVGFAALAAVMGLVCLAGWVLDVPWLASWSLDPEAIAVQPNTALAALVLSASIILLGTGVRAASAAGGLAAAALGAVVLFEHWAQIDLHIDRLLLFDREWGSRATVTPGRPGIPASFCFILLGLGIAGAARGSAPSRSAASALAITASAVAFLSLNGHLANAEPLYTLPKLTAIALPTALMMLAAAIGLLAALPDRPPVSTMLQPGPAGLLARRAFPLIIALPALIGWLRGVGEHAGYYDGNFGTALRTIVEVAVLCALLWWAVWMLRTHHRALVESEELNRRIVESTRDCVKVLDLDGRLRSMNRPGQRLFGIENLAPLIGTPYAGFWRPETQEAVHAAIERARNGGVGEFSAMLPTLRNETRWWDVTIGPIFGREGRVERLLAISRDVTERHREEEARAALVAIVANSEDAIVSKSLDGVIRSWNAGAERLFGWTAAEAIGKPIETIIPQEHRAEEKDILDRLARGERIAHFETVRLRKNGTRVDVSLSISPIKDDSGRIIGGSKVARDITAQKRTEAELRLHRERLEQLVAERTEELERSHRSLRAAERLVSLGTLAAGLGHDMGNLLIPIRLRLESLLQAPLSEQARHDVEAIRTGEEYLRRLASGLRLLSLDASKGAGETTEIGDWWREVEGVLGSVLPRGVVLDASLPTEPCHARVSRAGLTQAVFNLVQNAGDAMRERASGRVVVSGQVAGDRVVLRVTDDGPGMTPEVRARCMEPYYTTKSRGISTGLGLSLVAGVVRDAGGSVEVHSTEGVGTTFTLTFRRSESAVQPESSGEPTRTALVDLADARMRSIVIRELRSLGYDTDAPPSAPDVAVVDNAERAAAFGSETPVLLLNATAPGLNGNVRSLGERPPVSVVRKVLVEFADRTEAAPVE